MRLIVFTILMLILLHIFIYCQKYQRKEIKTSNKKPPVKKNKIFKEPTISSDEMAKIIEERSKSLMIKYALKEVYNSLFKTIDEGYSYIRINNAKEKYYIDITCYGYIENKIKFYEHENDEYCVFSIGEYGNYDEENEGIILKLIQNGFEIISKTTFKKL